MLSYHIPKLPDLVSLCIPSVRLNWKRPAY